MTVATRSSVAWRSEDYEVNEEWNCDKGRFAFRYLTDDRLTHPLIRDEEGDLVPASWPEAINFAAAKLAEVHGKVGVLTGGRLTREDAYAYAKFARVALGSDDIDFRSRSVDRRSRIPRRPRCWYRPWAELRGHREGANRSAGRNRTRRRVAHCFPEAAQGCLGGYRQGCGDFVVGEPRICKDRRNRPGRRTWR